MSRNWTDVDFRSYTRIFTNSNQSFPKDNIRLGYVSPYTDMTFKPGEETWFHFPLVPRDFEYKDDIRYTSGLPIQKSGLIEDGAIPGQAPYCSDRIYLKNVDYEWKDSGGGAQPRKMNNGTWLCTWLSGDITNPSGAKWMDRWYDPEVVLKSPLDSYKDIKDAPASAKAGIYDVPSRMVFKYGSQYRYYRTSKDDIQKFVDSVDAEGLILRINDWTSAGCYNSASATSATSVIRMHNTTDDMFDCCEVVPGTGDKGVVFNGKSVITVDTDSTNAQGKEFSIVAFIEHDDWKNSKKGAIIDRGIHGGWEIGASPTPYNNIICVLGEEKQTGMNSVSIYGPSFNLISTAKFTKDRRVIRAAVDDDYTVWGIRASDIVRIDINANITNSCPFPNDMVEYLVEKGRTVDEVTLQMLGGDYYGKMAVVCGPATVISEGEKTEVLSDTKVWIFDLTRCAFDDGSLEVSDFEGGVEVSERTMDGVNGLDTNSTSRGNTSWLEMDLMRDFYRRRSINDIDDDITGERIIAKDDDEEVFDVKVDSSYNIFVMTKKYRVEYDIDDNITLHKEEGPIGGRLLKFIKDRDGHFYLSKKVDLPVYSWSHPAGIVISSYNKDGKNITVVNSVMTDGYITRYSTDLTRLWTTNVSYYSGNIYTIANGYEWGRRFLNDALYARVLIGPMEEVLLNPGKRYLLTASLSKNLSDIDWHQVALVRDSSGFSLYINSVEKCRKEYESPDMSDWVVMYVANPNIVIGGDGGIGSELYEEHNMQDLFWDGKMDDLRIYSIAVKQGDLCYIHMCKYDVQPIYWNMEIYNKYYIETVERLYKMKMPGSKSQNYDVVINGYAMPDGDTDEFARVRNEITENVQDVLKEITPAYSQNGRVIFNGRNTIARWK